MHVAMLVSAVLGAIVVMVWRVRETQRPVTPVKIIVPPIAMSTGLDVRLSTDAIGALGVAAFLLGAVLLAIPLLRTSSSRARARRHVGARRRLDPIALVIVRLAARAWVEQYVSPLQTGALFFLLAFGMIVRWRVGMWLDYRALVAPAR